MQNRFLYFPSAEWPTEQMLKSENLKIWQATADDYQGLVIAHDAPAPNGTLVLFHGNGGTALDRGFYLKPFMNLGFRVILAEYPKYGDVREKWAKNLLSPPVWKQSVWLLNSIKSRSI